MITPPCSGRANVVKIASTRPVVISSHLFSFVYNVVISMSKQDVHRCVVMG